MSSYRQHFRSFTGYDSRFPDPFNDMATRAMPDSLRNALEWCEYVFHTHGTYRQAMERVISYFMTDLEFGEASDDEKDKWEDFLKTKLNIFTKLQCSLRNRECYGNDFTSLIVKFKRYLACPKCGYWGPLKEIYTNPRFQFKWDGSKFEFNAKCPKGTCAYHGPWRVDDKPYKDTDSISIRQWSPKEIETVHCYYSDQASYFWRIPESYRQDVIRGNLYHLERATKPVMQAIKHRQMFRFHDDAIFHMKEPTVSGIENRGWGLPRVLTNFRQIWYVQVLHRYNEAIALDYVIPFRLITPAPRGSGGGGGAMGVTQDPLATFNMGDARRHIDQMVKRRNRNPDDWYSLPFAVQYQVLGGDATQLAPTELLDQGHEKLLNDVGVPVDMYKGNLQLQAAPVALRLFEATWHHLVHDAIMWLKWITAQSAAILNWEEPDVSLRRVTIADDLEKQNVALQLMLADKISGTSAFRGIGFDWKEEQRLLGEEARTQAEIQAKVQEEMEQSGFAQEVAKGGAPGQPPAGDPAAGGAPPPGGDPAAGGAGGMMQGPVSNYISQMGPNTPVQPQDLMASAETIAQELLGLPEGVKDSELRKLKQANPTLHSLVRTKMDEMRNSMKNQGGAMLQQQMAAGAPA